MLKFNLYHHSEQHITQRCQKKVCENLLQRMGELIFSAVETRVKHIFLVFITQFITQFRKTFYRAQSSNGKTLCWHWFECSTSLVISRVLKLWSRYSIHSNPNVIIFIICKNIMELNRKLKINSWSKAKFTRPKRKIGIEHQFKTVIDR